MREDSLAVLIKKISPFQCEMSIPWSKRCKETLMNGFRRFKGFYRFKREGAALPYFYATHHHFAFRISHFAFFIQLRFSNVIKGRAAPRAKETLIQSLSDFTLEFLCIARNNLTRIASYLRKGMTELCIKILVKADSAIESAFP